MKVLRNICVEDLHIDLWFFGNLHIISTVVVVIVTLRILIILVYQWNWKWIILGYWSWLLLLALLSYLFHSLLLFLVFVETISFAWSGGSNNLTFNTRWRSRCLNIASELPFLKFLIFFGLLQYLLFQNTFHLFLNFLRTSLINPIHKLNYFFESLNHCIFLLKLHFHICFFSFMKSLKFLEI